MTQRIELLVSVAIVLVLASSAIGGTAWNVDFQGDRDHLRLFGQTNPVDHTELGIFWNTFEVQAFNSTTNSEFESNTSMTLLDAFGNDEGVALAFSGDLVGWAGSSGADSLVGDYLILASFAGIDTSSVSWTVSGLDANTEYDLTFYAHSTGGTGSPVRGIDYAMNGGVSFTQTNADAPVTVRVLTEVNGKIFGTAMNMLEPDAEGNWAGLQIERVPEPSTLALATLTLLGMSYCSRKHT
ncbi:PEP-CTERM sorting domain-containing protein [Bythopirellula polymerisocia]|uniref:Ice-binding protein C-terminal domain-containing protein n=1 Tax=Bythopirellula polymerisocia TaxID=2528003 RepID=A0A5C6CY36_9BACT|nr:PEP-CTERM sorting domain-containing protein [Bythopirellula polymerisocia]TWU29480.1 hypothetical protein Pla144_02580 [Bythopirellula polymerisocia]